jgi:hypothetical protein
MLFYRYHVETLKAPLPAGDIPLVASAVKELEELCRTRGMALIVVFIPEKEQVYRDGLPSRYNPPEHPLPPSSLWALETRLRQDGIAVLNLLPVFQAATERGQRLYWRDDTHWNPAGVELAATRVWQALPASSVMGGHDSVKQNF